MSLAITLKVALIFFGFFVLAHALLSRQTKNSYFMLKSILLGIATTILLLGFQIKNHRIDFIGIYIFTAGWLIYLIFFINLLNSVTLKMLDYLNSNQHGRLHKDEFEIIFNNQNGLEKRIDLMIKNGFFSTKGDKLYLTKKARILLSVISVISRPLSISLN